MARRAGATRSAAPSRSTTAALAVTASAIVLFTLASLIFHYFMSSPNYCGPLGNWLARLLDWVLGKSSLALPLVLALTAWVSLGRGRHWRKPAAILTASFALYLLLAVASHHLRLSAGVNLTGGLGCWLALAMAAAWGLGTYTIIPLAAIWATSIWTRRETRNDVLQTVFILLCGAFFGALIEYFAGRWTHIGPAPREAVTPFGGAVGRGIVTGLKAIVGPVGALIALIAGLLVVLALFARLRLPELAWLRALGAWFIGLFKPAPRPAPAESKRYDEPVIPAVRPIATEPGPEMVSRAVPAPPAPIENEHRLEPHRPPPRPRRLFPTAAKFDPSDFQKRFLECLDMPGERDRVFKDRKESDQEAAVLLDKLRQFSIEGRVSDILSGPLITRFEFEPAPGVKIQSIASRQDDISLALAAERIRILAPIPGKNAVGIEVPNKQRITVHLREVLTSASFQEEKLPLGFALGTSITGEPVCADLRTMPHILIAGTTGSGKSVCINSIIASIIFRSSPADVRFLTIDPKQLELPVYNPIPHLLSPTTIDPARAVNELNRVVNIMEMRYGEFANIGVRDIAGYNERAAAEGFAKKPYIVVIIDELADLMLRAPTEIEMRITRLAQMSRAVGIHLILATQRPSVDVITGLIKANFPCRIAFQVASKTDSRTILDMNGAESLLGRGDMLFLPPGKGDPMRLHGAFVSDRAAKRIVDLWAETWVSTLLNGLVEDPAERARRIVAADVVDVFYDREKSGIKKKQADLRSILPDDVVDSLLGRKYYDVLPEESPETLAERSRAQADTEREIDEKFADAAHIVVRHREASVSMLQRRLDVGWARAGRIIDQLEQAGIVGPYVGSKSRKVLVDNETGLAKLLAEAKPPGPGPSVARSADTAIDEP